MIKIKIIIIGIKILKLKKIVVKVIIKKEW